MGSSSSKQTKERTPSETEDTMNCGCKDAAVCSTEAVSKGSAAEEKKRSSSSSSSPDQELPVKVVRLQHQGHCTGMFWRGDPRTNAPPPDGRNWPRNGALLRGSGPYSVNGIDYFKVLAIQQAGKKKFVDVADGTWMLYEQEGLLLYDVEA